MSIWKIDAMMDTTCLICVCFVYVYISKGEQLYLSLKQDTVSMCRLEGLKTQLISQ